MAAPRYTIMREEISMVNALHYGDTRTSQTILDALLDIGATPTVLLLGDADDGVWTLDISLTIPANIILQIPFGVTIIGPGDLTLLGGVMALRSDWFQGAGTLTWLTGAALFQVNALRAGPTHLGSLVLDTPLPVGEGGTGARDAPQARINLGIVPGVDTQPWDATLATIASLAPDVDDYIYFTGPDQAARGVISTLGRTWLTHVAPSQMRSTMQLGALATLSIITTAYLTDKNVTYAKVQDVAAGRLLGNSGASPATVGEISVGAGLTLSGGVLAQAGGAVTGTGAANRLAFWSSTSVQTYHDRVTLTQIAGETDWPRLGIGTPAGVGHSSGATSLDTSGHFGVGGESQFWARMGLVRAKDPAYNIAVAAWAWFDGAVAIGRYEASHQLSVSGMTSLSRLGVGTGLNGADPSQIFAIWSNIPNNWGTILTQYFGFGGNPAVGGTNSNCQSWNSWNFKVAVGIGINHDASGAKILDVNGDVLFRANFQCNGTPRTWGTLWTDLSDASLKEDIRDIPDALGVLCQLQGRTYRWKELEHAGKLPGMQYGLVAQEVEAIVPHWVGQTEEGLKTLTINGWEALVIEAFKQVVARLRALEGDTHVRSDLD